MKLLRFGFIAMLLLMSASLCFGDIYMKQKNHTDGFQMMGQGRPEENNINEVWITDAGVCTQNDNMTMMMLSQEQKMVMINHQEKSYVEMPMDIGKILSQATEGGDAEETAQLHNMMGNMMKMEVTVTPSSETKTIREWKCKKYTVTIQTFMGPITQTIWATEDIQLDKDLYQKFSMAMFSAMPGMQKSLGDIMKKMEQVKGVQVETESTQTMMGTTITSKTELLEYKTGTAPQGLFKIPAGYTKKSMPMGM